MPVNYKTGNYFEEVISLKKLVFAIMFILIAVTAAHALDTSYETFEDLVSAMADGETESPSETTDEASGYVPPIGSAASPFNRHYQHKNENYISMRKDMAVKEIIAVGKHLTTRTDKIENITWVRSRALQRMPYLEVYSGELGGVIALRLAVETYGTTLLAVEQIILNVDGEILRIPLGSKNSKISSQAMTERAPLGGVVTKVWYKESIDIMVSGSQQIMSVLSKIPTSNSTAVRLRGLNASVDFTMSPASKTAFSNSMRYYEAKKTLLQLESHFVQ